MNNQSTRPLWERGLAVLVALLMVITMLPTPVQYTAFAEESNTNAAAASETITVEANSTKTLGELLALANGQKDNDTVVSLLKAATDTSYNFGVVPTANDVISDEGAADENGIPVAVEAKSVTDDNASGVTWKASRIALVAANAELDAADTVPDDGKVTLHRPEASTSYNVKVTYTATLTADTAEQEAALNKLDLAKSIYDLNTRVQLIEKDRTSINSVLQMDGMKSAVLAAAGDSIGTSLNYSSNPDLDTDTAKSDIAEAIANAVLDQWDDATKATMDETLVAENSDYANVKNSEKIAAYKAAMETLKDEVQADPVITTATEKLIYYGVSANGANKTAAQIGAACVGAIAKQLESPIANADNFMEDSANTAVWDSVAAAETAGTDIIGFLNKNADKIASYTKPDGFAAQASFTLQNTVEKGVAQTAYTVTLTASYYNVAGVLQDGDKAANQEFTFTAADEAVTAAGGPAAYVVDNLMGTDGEYSKTLETLKQDIASDTTEDGTLWNDLQKEEHYTRKSSEDTAAKTITFTYAPAVQADVKTYDEDNNIYYYGQIITFAAYNNTDPNATQKEYQYILNGKTYYQGGTYRVLGSNIAFDRVEKEASKEMNLAGLMGEGKLYPTLGDTQKKLLTDYFSTGKVFEDKTEKIRPDVPTSQSVTAEQDKATGRYNVTAKAVDSNLSDGSQWIPQTLIGKSDDLTDVFKKSGSDYTASLESSSVTNRVTVEYGLDLSGVYDQNTVNKYLTLVGNEKDSLYAQVQNAKTIVTGLRSSGDYLNLLNTAGANTFRTIAANYTWTQTTESPAALNDIADKCYSTEGLILYALTYKDVVEPAEIDGVMMKYYFDNFTAIQSQLETITKDMAILLKDGNLDANLNKATSSMLTGEKFERIYTQLLALTDDAEILNNGNYTEEMITLLLSAKETDMPTLTADDGDVVLKQKVVQDVEGFRSFAVKITVDGVTYEGDAVSFDSDKISNTWTSEQVDQLNKAVKALLTEKLGDKQKYYEVVSGEPTTNDKPGDVTVAYQAKTYTIVVDNKEYKSAYGGSYSLPTSSGEADQNRYTYSYTVNGVDFAASGMLNDNFMNAYFTDGDNTTFLTVTRTSTDNLTEGLKSYLAELNDADNSGTLTFIPYQDASGNITDVVLRLTPNSTSKDLDVMQIAKALISASSISLNGEDVLAKTGDGTKVTLQAILNAAAEVGTSTETLKGAFKVDGEEATAIQLNAPGKLVMVTGVTADTEPGANLLKDKIKNMQITIGGRTSNVNLYLTIDGSKENLYKVYKTVNSLATNNTATAAFDLSSNGLTLDTDTKSLYSAAVAAMLLTESDVSLDDLTGANVDKLIALIKETAEPLFADDTYDKVTPAVIDATLGTDLSGAGLSDKNVALAKTILKAFFTGNNKVEGKDGLYNLEFDAASLLSDNTTVADYVKGEIKLAVQINEKADDMTQYAAMVVNTDKAGNSKKDKLKNAYGLYTSMADANAAARDGAFVVLLNDVNDNIEFANTVTLDLNGKTVTGNLTAASGKTVTVRDRSMEKTGTVTGDLTGTGKFNLKAGNYPNAVDLNSKVSNGFAADSNGKVSNKLYTVEENNNTVKVTLSADLLDQIYAMDTAEAKSVLKTTLANALYDTALNAYDSASLTVGGYTLYDASKTELDLFELTGLRAKVNGWIGDSASSAIRKDQINALVSDMLDKLEGANLKDSTTIATYTATTQPFGLTLGVNNAGTKLTAKLKADASTKTRKFELVVADSLLKQLEPVTFDKLEANVENVTLQDDNTLDVEAAGSVKATVDLTGSTYAQNLLELIAAYEKSGNLKKKLTNANKNKRNILTALDNVTVGEVKTAAQHFDELQKKNTGIDAAYELVLLAVRAMPDSKNNQKLGSWRDDKNTGVYQITAQDKSLTKTIMNRLTGKVTADSIDLTLKLYGNLDAAFVVYDSNKALDSYESLRGALNSLNGDGYTIKVEGTGNMTVGETETLTAQYDVTIDNADRINWNGNKITLTLKAGTENDKTRGTAALTVKDAAGDGKVYAELDAGLKDLFDFASGSVGSDEVYTSRALVSGYDATGNKVIRAGWSLADTIGDQYVVIVELNGNVTLNETINLDHALTIKNSDKLTEGDKAEFTLTGDGMLTVSPKALNKVVSGTIGRYVDVATSGDTHTYELKNSVDAYDKDDNLKYNGTSLSGALETPDVAKIVLHGKVSGMGDKELSLDHELTILSDGNFGLDLNKTITLMSENAKLTVDTKNITVSGNVKLDRALSGYYLDMNQDTAAGTTTYSAKLMLIGEQANGTPVYGRLEDLIKNPDVVKITLNTNITMDKDLTLDHEVKLVNADKLNFNGYTLKLTASGKLVVTKNDALIKNLTGENDNWFVIYDNGGYISRTKVLGKKADGNEVTGKSLADTIAEVGTGTVTVNADVTVGRDVTLKGTKLTIAYNGGEITDLNEHKFILAPADGAKYDANAVAASVTLPKGATTTVEMASSLKSYFELKQNGTAYELKLIAPQFTNGGKLERDLPVGMLSGYSSQMGVKGDGKTWNLLYLDMKGGDGKAYMTSGQFQNGFKFSSKGGDLTMQFVEPDGTSPAADLSGAMDSLNELKTATQVVATVKNPYYNGTMPTQTYVLIMLGDVNCDGEANSGDAVVMRKEYFAYPQDAGINWNFFTREAADINQNDFEPTDSGDAVKLQRKYQKPDEYVSSLNGNLG